MLSTPHHQGYQWLKDKILSEEGRRQQAKLKELQAIAERLGCTLPQLAIGTRTWGVGLTVVPGACQESLRAGATPSISQPEVMGLQLSWTEPGGHLSPWKQLVPGLSQKPVQPRPGQSPPQHAGPSRTPLALRPRGQVSVAPSGTGQKEGPLHWLCVPHLWSSCPSLVPEERGGQLRAPGCFQRGPAHGEHRSHTGELGRGLLGVSPPPRPCGRTQGQSQSLVLPVFVGHLPWASFAVSIPATAELP